MNSYNAETNRLGIIWIEELSIDGDSTQFAIFVDIEMQLLGKSHLWNLRVPIDNSLDPLSAPALMLALSNEH